MPVYSKHTFTAGVVTTIMKNAALAILLLVSLNGRNQQEDSSKAELPRHYRGAGKLITR